jgi:hypothetical protein
LVDTKVIIRPGGAYFVSSWDVHRALRKYTPLDFDSGQLFRVGKQTFEILQYMEDARQYWVRPFATDLSEEDIARLLGGD